MQKIIKIKSILFSAFLWAVVAGAAPKEQVPPSVPQCEVLAEPFGPFDSLVQNSERRLSEVNKFHFMTFNVLNLYRSVGKAARDPETGEILRDASSKAVLLASPSQPRTEEEIEQTAAVIHEINADLGLYQEIEGRLDTLAQFDDQNLNDKYYPFLIRGNDPRGINVAMLATKNFPFQYEYISFRRTKLTDPVLNPEGGRIFSRDAAALVVRARGADPRGPPLFVSVVVHSKSKRNSLGDRESKKRRTAQGYALAAVYKYFQQLYGSDVRFMIGGDFNTAMGDQELRPLYDAGLAEAFTLLPDAPLPPMTRYTHAYFPRNYRSGKELPAKYDQIDSFFLSPSLQRAFRDTKVYRYHDAEGKDLGVPRTLDERKRQPSDHNPVELFLDGPLIVKDYLEELWRAGYDSADFVRSLL